MGWYGTKQTRAQAVREITRSHENATCIAFTEVPDGVWSVWQLTGKGEHTKNRAGQRIIALDLIDSRADGVQMVKTMDETMGPCYYDCPPAYLALATDFAAEGYSAGWREKVRAESARIRPADLRGVFGRSYNDSRDIEDAHSDADPGL